MTKIKPCGSKLLILPISKENYVTKGNIELVENELSEGKVIEVGTDVQGLYSEGDIVIYPQDAGLSQVYNGESYLWLNGQAPNIGGDVWGIVTKSASL